MVHALLGAIEAYATGNNALIGATGAVSGELAAKIITEQLYQKTPEQLTEAQKQTVSALSQIASGLAGVAIGDSTASGIVSAEIGKRAVENNFLSEQEISILEKLSQKRVLTQQDMELISRIKLKDKYSDELLARYQSDSDSLTDYEYGQLRMWVNEWLNYNSVEVDRVLSSKPITEMSLKYYNPELEHKYKQAKTIYSSFDYGVSSSTSEALALASLNTSGGLLVKGIEKLPQLGKLAEKYPLITEITATGIANTGYQLSQGGEYDPYSLLQSELSTVLTRGKPLGQQVSINIGISTLATEKSEDYGWNALGAVTGTVGAYSVNKIKLKNPFFNSISSGVISEALGDSTNLEKQYNNLKGIEYENK